MSTHAIGLLVTRDRNAFYSPEDLVLLDATCAEWRARSHVPVSLTAQVAMRMRLARVIFQYAELGERDPVHLKHMALDSLHWDAPSESDRPPPAGLRHRLSRR